MCYFRSKSSAVALNQSLWHGESVNATIAPEISPPESAENPVRAGDELVIYATGMGITSPQVEAGLPGPDSPLAETVIAPEVQLGDQTLEVTYSGLAPGQVGVYQMNVRVSASVRGGGSAPLRIRQGESETELAVPVEE